MKKLLNKFGPCGLSCEKCFAFNEGAIKHSAQQLKNSLGKFDNYAKRFVTLLDEPIFSKYLDFKDFLNYLSIGNCKGCREQICHLFKDCNVKICYIEKKVDYCYQCNEFPCNNSGFDENLEKRWIVINKKIKEIGLENYYNEIKNKPRY